MKYFLALHNWIFSSTVLMKRVPSIYTSIPAHLTGEVQQISTGLINSFCPPLFGYLHRKEFVRHPSSCDSLLNSETLQKLGCSPVIHQIIYRS